MKIDLCEIFGVKPDQVFKIKSENFSLNDNYRVHGGILQFYSEIRNSWIRSISEANGFSHNFEVILYSATEDEKTILRNLDKKYRNGYVARDKGGKIYAFESCPTRYVWGYDCSYMGHCNLPYSHLFQFILFDTGAVRIKDIIRE